MLTVANSRIWLAVGLLGLIGCAAKVDGSARDGSIASTAPRERVTTTIVVQPDGSPPTVPESLPPLPPDASVSTTAPPPPPDGYPQSVLGKIDPATSRLTFNPVSYCQFQGTFRTTTAVEVVASYPNLGYECLVGPAYLTGEQFEDATTSKRSDQDWLVLLEPTADGADALNQLSKMCYSAQPACPSQQLAIMLDGEVISAPMVLTDHFDGTMQISGFYDEQEATDLANSINNGG